MTMTVLPIIGMIIAFFVFKSKYHLTAEKVEEMAQKIREKRGQERA